MSNTYTVYRACPSFSGPNADIITNALKSIFQPAGVEQVLRIRLSDLKTKLDEGWEVYPLVISVNGEPLLSIQVVR